MDLLVGDEETELLVFLDFSLKFESQGFNGLLKFVDNHLFLADKINFSNAANDKFHEFLILFDHSKVFDLEGLFQLIKCDQGMRVNFSTVQNVFSLRVDNQLMVLLLKDKTYGMIGRFLFHPKASMNYYESFNRLREI